MDEEVVSPILASAALLVVAATVVLLVAVDHRSATALRLFVAGQVQRMALAVAAVATFGSLYYSEYVGFTPCEYCWYQRIAMYPIAVLLFVGTVTRDRLKARYVVTPAAIGLALSIYHYQLQLFPEQGSTCSGGVACTARMVSEFDFVSIPFMAGCGFLAILLLYVAEWRSRSHLAYELDEDGASEGSAAESLA